MMEDYRNGDYSNIFIFLSILLVVITKMFNMLKFTILAIVLKHSAPISFLVLKYPELDIVTAAKSQLSADMYFNLLHLVIYYYIILLNKYGESTTQTYITETLETLANFLNMITFKFITLPVLLYITAYYIQDVIDAKFDIYLSVKASVAILASLFWTTSIFTDHVTRDLYKGEQFEAKNRKSLSEL